FFRAPSPSCSGRRRKKGSSPRPSKASSARYQVPAGSAGLAGAGSGAAAAAASAGGASSAGLSLLQLARARPTTSAVAPRRGRLDGGREEVVGGAGWSVIGGLGSLRDEGLDRKKDRRPRERRSRSRLRHQRATLLLGVGADRAVDRELIPAPIGLVVAVGVDGVHPVGVTPRLEDAGVRD